MELLNINKSHIKTKTYYYINRNLCIKCSQIEEEVVALHVLTMVHIRGVTNLRLSSQLETPHPMDQFSTATNEC
jgi:hypothetical protein